MALSFNAEKKYVEEIFGTKAQYVIPSYQRPYSWEYDQCLQLYSDLMQAFEEGEDYFIGNIIIAKSEKNKGVLQVVDGQQRLITLLLLIKVLSILRSNLVGLRELLTIKTLDGNSNTPKIKSDIFETNDEEKLKKIFAYQADDFRSEQARVSDKQGNILKTS